MKVTQNGFCDQNDHDYHFFLVLLKCDKSTYTHTEVSLPNVILKTQMKEQAIPLFNVDRLDAGEDE